jgi:hypothetical protein
MRRRERRMKRQRMMVVAGRSRMLRKRTVMQEQKINETYGFHLLMLLEMLNKTRKSLNFRTIGKWSKSVCTQAQTKQYGCEAVSHSTNIEKKSQLTKRSLPKYTFPLFK